PGWHRKLHVGESVRPADDLAGVGDDRADRGREWSDEKEQQRRRHDGGGKPALSPEKGLELAQDRPCGHDDHRGPDGRREERPQNPDRGGDEPADDKDCKNGAGEVAAEILFHDRRYYSAAERCKTAAATSSDLTVAPPLAIVRRSVIVTLSLSGG